MKKLILIAATLILGTSLVFANGSAENSGAAPKASTTPVLIKVAGVNQVMPAYPGNVKFKELVDKALPGKYDIQLYGNNVLGDDLHVAEAVRMGTIQMCVVDNSVLAGLVPQVSVLNLPFLFPNSQAAWAVCNGSVGQKLDSLLAEKGFQVMTYYENGFRDLTNSVRAVSTPADLKGMKIRVMESPLQIALWRSLGANATPMPFTELFTAMQQKTVDGQENPVPTIYNNKFYEVQKFVTLDGHSWSAHMFLANKKFFDALPAGDQKVLLDAAQQSAKYEFDLSASLVKEATGKLTGAGMTVTTLTPEQLKLFQDAAAPVYKQLEPSIGKDLIDEAKQIVANVK
ncbi:MAG TPA: DctP family TRAP transporter solute-binding subunit [Spirochaetia bacterium]|nr:DctP family TRAP transporter solute-binding subunit [Spirochaetia bacterium]